MFDLEQTLFKNIIMWEVSKLVCMAEFTVTPCMRYTQMNEIPAAKRRGDKERKTERQRETGQTITVTIFYRLTV